MNRKYFLFFSLAACLSFLGCDDKESESSSKCGDVTCEEGQTCINAKCYTNPVVCGQTVCGASEVCKDDVCCRQNETTCSGACADLKTDSNNCGACGTKCGENAYCAQGTCKDYDCTSADQIKCSSDVAYVRCDAATKTWSTTATECGEDEYCNADTNACEKDTRACREGQISCVSDTEFHSCNAETGEWYPVNETCADGTVCRDNECKPKDCEPGATKCGDAPNEILTCSESGEWGKAEDCTAQLGLESSLIYAGFCRVNETTSEAACKSGCKPGTKENADDWTDANIAYTYRECTDQGYWSEAKSCESGLKFTRWALDCVECAAHGAYQDIYSPEVSCETKDGVSYAKVCGSDNKWQSTACASDEICLAKTGTCEKKACTDGEKRCDGSTGYMECVSGEWKSGTCYSTEGCPFGETECREFECLPLNETSCLHEVQTLCMGNGFFPKRVMGDVCPNIGEKCVGGFTDDYEAEYGSDYESACGCYFDQNNYEVITCKPGYVCTDSDNEMTGYKVCAPYKCTELDKASGLCTEDYKCPSGKIWADGVYSYATCGDDGVWSEKIRCPEGKAVRNPGLFDSIDEVCVPVDGCEEEQTKCEGSKGYDCYHGLWYETILVSCP